MISSRVVIHKACSKYLATSVGFWFLNCCFLAIFVAEHFWQDHAYLGPFFTTLCFRQITGEIGIQEARHRSQSCKFLWLLAPRKRRGTGDWWIRRLSSKRRAHSPSKVVWGSLSDQINILAVKPMARLRPYARLFVCIYHLRPPYFWNRFQTSQKSDAEMKGLDHFCLVFMFWPRPFTLLL